MNIVILVVLLLPGVLVFADSLFLNFFRCVLPVEILGEHRCEDIR
jgi:hypothetical protein